MTEEGENRKKKAGKKGVNVPLSELGFKAKVYYGIETEYTRRRVKYKAARYQLLEKDMALRIVNNASWVD